MITTPGPPGYWQGEGVPALGLADQVDAEVGTAASLAQRVLARP